MGLYSWLRGSGWDILLVKICYIGGGSGVEIPQDVA